MYLHSTLYLTSFELFVLLYFDNLLTLPTLLPHSLNALSPLTTLLRHSQLSYFFPWAWFLQWPSSSTDALSFPSPSTPLLSPHSCLHLLHMLPFLLTLCSLHFYFISMFLLLHRCALLPISNDTSFSTFPSPLNSTCYLLSSLCLPCTNA